MTSRIAVDTNVLLYSLDLDAPAKLAVAAAILDRNPVISSQNVSEFINVLLRRWSYPKEKLGLVLREVLESCVLCPTSSASYIKAIELSKKYDFQIFDAIVIASALEAGCEVLLTEDLQHMQLIENRLTIKNPFK
jgi:predicted nucleic acid-binding protein